MYQKLLYVQEVVTPFYIVSYFIKWVTTSWTYSIFMLKKKHPLNRPNKKVRKRIIDEFLYLLASWPNITKNDIKHAVERTEYFFYIEKKQTKKKKTNY